MSDYVQRDAFNASRDSLSYPEIPEAELFQKKDYSYERPVEVHGWGWSVTFGKWGALVTFADGWHGYTWPKLKRST